MDAPPPSSFTCHNIHRPSLAVCRRLQICFIVIFVLFSFWCYFVISPTSSEDEAAQISEENYSFVSVLNRNKSRYGVFKRSRYVSGSVNSTSSKWTRTNYKPGQACFFQSCITKCCSGSERFASSDDYRCVSSSRFLSIGQFFESVNYNLRYICSSLSHQRINTNQLAFFHLLCQETVHETAYRGRSERIPELNNSLDVRLIIKCLDFVEGNDNLVAFGLINNIATAEADTLLPKTNLKDNRIFRYILLFCMLLSEVSLLVVLVVYIYLPQLRTIHGKILVCYLISVIIFHPAFVMQLFHRTYIVIHQEILTLALLNSVNWLSIMCFDIWYKFSHPLLHRRPESISQRQKFNFYLFFGWGFPALLFLYQLTFVTSVMFFNIYLEVFLDLFMFLCTAINLRIQSSTQTNSIDSRRHGSYSNEGMLMFVKLSLLMGFDWFLFFLTNLVDYQIFPLIVLVIIESQGVFLFVLLVWNTRVKALIRQKWRSQARSSCV